MKNADMPAMPVLDNERSFPLDMERYGSKSEADSFAFGLTKREMMAMHIATGFAADKEARPCDIAKLATEVADLLLAELEKPQ